MSRSDSPAWPRRPPRALQSGSRRPLAGPAFGGPAVGCCPVPRAVGTALPFFKGTCDRRAARLPRPEYWRAAIADAVGPRRADRRIMVLPGQLFSWYRWGETWLGSHRLSDRPVLVRQASPTRTRTPASSRPRSTTSSRRAGASRGSSWPLLALMAVGQVLCRRTGIRGSPASPGSGDGCRARSSPTLQPWPRQPSPGPRRTYLAAESGTRW